MKQNLVRRWKQALVMLLILFMVVLTVPELVFGETYAGHAVQGQGENDVREQEGAELPELDDEDEQDPEKTEQPDPSVTDQPEVTEEPDITEEPNITEEQQDEETPAVTETPDDETGGRRKNLRICWRRRQKPDGSRKLMGISDIGFRMEVIQNRVGKKLEITGIILMRKARLKQAGSQFRAVPII